MTLPIDGVTLPAQSGDKLEVANPSTPDLPLKSWRYVYGGVGLVGRWYFEYQTDDSNTSSGDDYRFGQGVGIDPTVSTPVIDGNTGNVVTPVVHDLDVSLLSDISLRPNTP